MDSLLKQSDTDTTEPGGNGAAEPRATAADSDQTSLEQVFDDVLQISKDAEREASQQTDRQQDGQTVGPPAAESKWAVGARCRAVWSEDGCVYSATVVASDGERCRVRFHGYGNEEDVELSALQSPDDAPLQDWRSGSRCRAVYSEDGRLYPAVVLWVKGQRCRVRYDDYNNEEEHDVSSLLNSDELHGPSKISSWKSNTTSSRKRRDDSRGGERRAAGREDRVKDGGAHQITVETESDEKKRGGQQRDAAEKPTNHSFPFFPPFPPPLPLPPTWPFGGSESVDSASSMLMLWYMYGFHTGSFMTQQLFRSTSKD
ncbi:survival motor neuron protein-like [Embiotoca jacksoni]|uniref:survival motor neuron protein-like n=1 Tax=Embiotoca jacksoni TaxID=100190 RepID=UPI0037043FA0